MLETVPKVGRSPLFTDQRLALPWGLHVRRASRACQSMFRDESPKIHGIEAATVPDELHV
jgi:hypothetical protein